MLRRRSAWILVPTLIGAAGGAALALSSAPDETAEVLVQVRNASASLFVVSGPGVDRLISMPTEECCTQSRPTSPSWR